MSEQRWTAPEAGWYRYDSQQGFPLEFLGTERPEAEPCEGGVMHIERFDACMDSSAETNPRSRDNVSPMIVVPWPS